MAVVVWSWTPLGGGMGGWDERQEMVAIYSSKLLAKTAINATGCTKYRDGKWTRDPDEGEYLSDITSYIISNELPLDAALKTRNRRSKARRLGNV